MDLGAYARISTLSETVAANGISVPRLRGFRLMRDEEVVTPETITEMKHRAIVDGAQNLIDAYPMWSNGGCLRFYWRTEDKRHRYLLYGDDDGYNHPVSIRWDRIHGKHRKNLKFAIKKKCREIDRQFEAWNKYAGKEDILYIHARIGGYNWPYYKGEVENQPWFIEKIDDYFDGTYCDIYARIDPDTLPEPSTEVDE